MPIPVPNLADLDALVLSQSMVERLTSPAATRAIIQAHTPEYTNPRPGDPGLTLIDLFAWLGETILYRANLIPERQRLAFLRLLGEPLRPARAAEGVVSLRFDSADADKAVTLPPSTPFPGPVPFETLAETNVYPLQGEVYIKRVLTADERRALAGTVERLAEFHRLTERPMPYVTTRVYGGNLADPAGVDLAEGTVDQSLWLALLAAKPEKKEAARQSLGEQSRICSIGFEPWLAVPALFEQIGPRGAIPHVWEITTNVSGDARLAELETVEDTTAGLTRRGVVRLQLPAPDVIAAPENDVRREAMAGVGDQPPRLDDLTRAERLVGWIRLRPRQRMTGLRVSWLGWNAVAIDQRTTVRGAVVGESSGQPRQQVSLRSTGVERASFSLEVEEPNQGFQPWNIVDDLALAARDDNAFTLDEEAGTVEFGDGVRGRVPAAGMRFRVARLRAGGGEEGNLPPGTLKEISVAGPLLKVEQVIATRHGERRETLAEAERRLPAIFRHRNRAVTADDYESIAAATPGARLGRVIVLPRFKPHQRRSDVPGVVTLMVLPQKEERQAPNPRPDRPLLERVHEHLSARSPLSTEVYVIGCEYRPLGVSVAVSIREGFAREAVLSEVRAAVRRFLWPLPPGGIDQEGWRLGGRVQDREIEVVVARVAGVDAVAPVGLFEWNATAKRWRRLSGPSAVAPVEMRLDLWQMPELLSLVVEEGAESATDLAPEGLGTAVVAVPVVPETC